MFQSSPANKPDAVKQMNRVLESVTILSLWPYFCFMTIILLWQTFVVTFFCCDDFFVVTILSLWPYFCCDILSFQDHTFAQPEMHFHEACWSSVKATCWLHGDATSAGLGSTTVTSFAWTPFHYQAHKGILQLLPTCNTKLAKLHPLNALMSCVHEAFKKKKWCCPSMLSYALSVAQLQAVMHKKVHEQICNCCLDVTVQLVLGCALSTVRSMAHPIPRHWPKVSNPIPRRPAILTWINFHTLINCTALQCHSWLVYGSKHGSAILWKPLMLS